MKGKVDLETPGLSPQPLSHLTNLSLGSQAAWNEWGLPRLHTSPHPWFLSPSGLQGWQESSMGTPSLLEISQLSQQAWLHLTTLPQALV